MQDITFYDVRKEPFSIHGLWEPQRGGEFLRIPQEVAENANAFILNGLYRNTAGGRVRFTTNSDTLVVRAIRTPEDELVPLSPYLEFGFDLYIKRQFGEEFLDVKLPVCRGNGNVRENVFKLPEGEKELTLYFPCYGSVADLELGLKTGSTLRAHSPYTYKKPVLFYGSSITQGAAASRPGKAYPTLLSHRFGFDFINFGFAGGCLGEESLCRYMASLPIGAFVSDYDHNRSSAAKLATNHFRVYEIIREKHPDIPYYMISRPDFQYTDAHFDRRAVVMESYLKAWRGGDRNVYFIDGSVFFADTPNKLEYTIDTCHPTDEGFQRMANLIGTVFANTMDFEKLK